MTVTQWGYPFRLWTKSRCFTNYIQNLIPKILLNSYSPRKYFKISSKLWFMDRYLSRCKIQSFLKNLNFCPRENLLAKIKHFFLKQKTPLRPLSVKIASVQTPTIYTYIEPRVFNFIMTIGQSEIRTHYLLDTGNML